MMPEDLQKDAEILAENGFCFEIVPEGERFYMRFKDFPLPEGVYNAEKTTLLIFTTQLYPKAGFDMFWTDPELKLKNGSVPGRAGVIQSHLGQKWRRFSYHPYNEMNWNPSEDDVARYVEYVQQRLRNGD